VEVDCYFYKYIDMSSDDADSPEPNSPGPSEVSTSSTDSSTDTIVSSVRALELHSLMWFVAIIDIAPTISIPCEYNYVKGTSV
jgi:hypothetical protein